MKLIKIVCLGLLVIYSLVIIGIEATSSQEHVRYYLTDIYGPVFLFAINTTISLTLLWSIALLFVVSALCVEGEGNRKRTYFYVSQSVLFVYLGFDERLMLHEYAGIRFGFEDALLLLGLGLAEAGALVGLGELRTRPRRVSVYLFAAAVFFVLMLAVDAFVPKAARLRLSFEDLSKLWAEVFLFVFAFDVLRDEIEKLKRRARPAERTTV